MKSCPSIIVATGGRAIIVLLLPCLQLLHTVLWTARCRVSSTGGLLSWAAFYPDPVYGAYGGFVVRRPYGSYYTDW